MREEGGRAEQQVPVAAGVVAFFNEHCYLYTIDFYFRDHESVDVLFTCR